MARHPSILRRAIPLALYLAGAALVAAFARDAVWGLSAPAEFPLAASLAALAVAALAFHPRADALLARGLGRVHGAAAVAALIAASGLAAWIGRVRFPWLGDQILWIRTLSTDLPVGHLLEPLSFAFAWSLRDLGPRTAAGLVTGPAVGSVLLGVPWALGSWWLAGLLAPRGAPRAWLWALMLCAPARFLFHGYVESYALLLAALVLCAAAALRGPRSRAGPWAWPAAALAAGAHVMGAGVLPALWAAAAPRGRRMALVGTGAIATGIALWFAAESDTYAAQRKGLRDTLALFDPATSFLGPRHLGGVANALLANAGPVLAVLFVLPWTAAWRGSRRTLLGLALFALPGLAGLGLVRSALGPLRDWDLFAGFLFFLYPLAGWLWLRGVDAALPRFSAALLTLTLAHTVFWVGVDADAARGEARARRLYGTGERFAPQALALTADEMAFLARTRDDTAAAAWWYGRAGDIQPRNWRYHFNEATMLLPLGRAAEAESALVRSVALDPPVENPYTALGAVRLQAGNPAGALEAFERGLTRVGETPRLREGREAALRALEGR